MKFVIFDIDGTLINTKQVEDKSFIKAFYQTFQIDIKNQKWENLKNVTDWGITEEIIENHLNRKPSPEEYHSMKNNFLSILEENYNLDFKLFSEIPEATNFFHDLKRMNKLAVGIATGGWEKTAKMKLGKIGIDLNDICISTSDDHITREAITTEVITQLKTKHQVNPEKIIYFGDGEWDFKTCKNLGISFIGIDVENNGKLKKLGTKLVFPNYLNKTQILQAIQSV